MEIKLYNTLTRKKEIFKPLHDKKAGIYACGPTVYDSAHIGNLRTYIFEDILKRTLVYNGYKVKHVMNITDIEDKIIKKMRAEGRNLEEVTEPFIKIFFSDLKKLNIQKADAYPKATETIEKIIRLIGILLKKKYAYRGSDGSVYFDVSKFKSYGKLSRLNKRQIKSGARADENEYGKKEAVDFALWKAAKPNEPSWPSPFGPGRPAQKGEARPLWGRPGWHIECSAMSMKHLGKSFDIHCGAADLVFPHHENEIAQSEAATGKKFVNFWIEGEHLLADGKKMSKSLGNFYTLTDIEKRGFEPLAFRYLILTIHYRSQLNFTWKSLKAGQNALANLRQAVLGIQEERRKSRSVALSSQNSKEKFLKSLNDDLNMPQALAILWETVKNDGISAEEKYELVLDFDKVLGLNLGNVKAIPIPDEISALARQRERLREEKKWTEADEIREELEKKGWIVKDNKVGTEIMKIKER